MRRRGIFAADALQTACEDMDAREASLAYRLTLTVTQNGRLIDAALDAARRKPSSARRQSVGLTSAGNDILEPLVRDILRLGAAQLLFLRVPPHAVVNEAVVQAKASCPRAAGLVNAMLRKIVGQTPESIAERLGGTRGSRAALALRYSLPDWLTDELLNRLTLEEAETFAAVTGEIRPVTLIENPLRPYAGVDSVGEPHPFLPGARRYSGAAFRAPGFADGCWLVTDAGAYAVVSAMGLKPGMSVWDACSAPGGKSFLAALDMHGQGRVMATDISEKKLDKIRAGAKRLGLESGLDIRRADASKYQPEGVFDAVLCDVPCSGLGVLANKPDIRNKNPESFVRLPQVQRDLLDNAVKAVRPGGVLVYATCTFRKAENEDVTSAFLEENPDFKREGFHLPFRGDPKDLYIASGEVTLWPHVHGTDGFYVCRMRRAV